MRIPNFHNRLLLYKLHIEIPSITFYPSKTRNKGEALFSKLNRLCIGQILQKFKINNTNNLKKIGLSLSYILAGWESNVSRFIEQVSV